MGHLKTLDVTNNDLVDLPHGIGYIAALSRVAVDGNKLRSIRRQLLGSCEKLKQYLRTRGDSPSILDPKLSYDERNSTSEKTRTIEMMETNIIQRTRKIESS